ncbi:MAG: VTT domain-containing protein [Actinomycetes bacterium]
MVVVGTFLFCLLSAVVPVANAELYLLGVSVATDTSPVALAVAAALGQMLGKLLFYLVGRGALDLSRLRRKGTAKGRWSERMDRVQAWCDRHAWGPTAVTAVSAFAGLPPFAVVSVLAGTLRMRWWLFAGVGFVGRFGRFLAVLLAPGLLPEGLVSR